MSNVQQSISWLVNLVQSLGGFNLHPVGTHNDYLCGLLQQCIRNQLNLLHFNDFQVTIYDKKQTSRGGSRWIFDVMLGSGTNLRPNVQTFLPEKCTHFTKMYRKFGPKMHPSLWNVQKIWPKIVPICMPYAGQILFKDIPLFLKSTEC